MSIQKISFSFVVILFSSFCLSSCYLEKIDEIPDFTQTDVTSKNGGTYCGPTSVSNSFIWLDNNGFSNLVPGSWNQDKLIIELADDELEELTDSDEIFLNTFENGGTNPYYLMQGVENYVKYRGYTINRLEFQGWRVHYHPGTNHSTGVWFPQLSWIKSGIQGTGSVWLNFGWFKHDEDSDVYEIIGAHWVTLVGYTPKQLVIHDPSARSEDGANEYISLELIDSGTMTGNFTNLPRPAAGYYKVEEGLKINTSGGANVAILSGAVVLEIK